MEWRVVSEVYNGISSVEGDVGREPHWLGESIHSPIWEVVTLYDTRSLMTEVPGYCEVGSLGIRRKQYFSNNRRGGNQERK